MICIIIGVQNDENVSAAEKNIGIACAGKDKSWGRSIALSVFATGLKEPKKKWKEQNHMIISKLFKVDAA